ncbi:reverse transcriptase [Trichonephila clavipes]|nr:reverse transcriptase [Trichonephila clavipes]
MSYYRTQDTGLRARIPEKACYRSFFCTYTYTSPSLMWIIQLIRESCVTSTNSKSLGKPWETLTTVDPIPRHFQKVEAVARFRLTIRHDSLKEYLHWFGLTVDEACPLYGHSIMDGNHLVQCTGLDKYPTDDVVSQYCEALH